MVLWIALVVLMRKSSPFRVVRPGIFMPLLLPVLLLMFVQLIVVSIASLFADLLLFSDDFFYRRLFNQKYDKLVIE